MRNRNRWLAATGCFVLAGCQVVAGLEERTAVPVEEPSAGAGGGASGSGPGGAAGDAGANTGGTSAGGAGAAGSSGASGSSGGGAGASAGAAGAAGSAGAGGGGLLVEGTLPDRPLGSAVEGGGQVVTFIAKRIFFGSRDEKLNPDPSQWRNYGLNWDRTCTTSMGMAGMGGAPSLACKKPPTSSGSPLTTLGTPGYFDGNDCRDNAFGGTLIPLLTFFQSSPEVGLDAETAEGGPTFVLRISDLVDATKNGDDTYAPGELFFTLNRDTFRTGPNLTPGPVDFEASPAQLRTMDASSAAYRYKPAGGVEKIADWDPTGAGPKLEPTDMYVGMTSRVRFPKAYVRNHVWISGDLAASETSALVPLGGYVAEVKAAASVAVIELDPTDHRKAPKRAQIATVVDGQSFTDALTSPQSPLLKCGPSKNTPKELVATIIRESADLKAGASDFRDNAQFCDLLSLGAGVEWVPTRIADFPAGVPPFKFGCAEPGGYPIRIPLDGSGGAGGASGAGGAAGAGGSAGASGGSAGNGGASAGNAGKAGAGG